MNTQKALVLAFLLVALVGLATQAGANEQYRLALPLVLNGHPAGPSPTPTNTATPTATGTPTNTPTPTSTMALPTPSPTPPPAVYTPDAKDLVLSLSDMPSGYALNPEESGRLAPNDTYSDAYEVVYENWDLLFSGTPLVGNWAGVARSEQLARDVIQNIDQGASADPEYEPISCSTFGDETICYRAVYPEDDIVLYIVVFRKANLIETVITGGVLGVAPFEDTLTFAEIVLGKVDTAIGAQVLTHEDVTRMGGTNSRFDASNLDVSHLLHQVARCLEDASQR